MRAADDHDRLVKRLILCKEELETGAHVEKHRDLYERYFVVGKTRSGAVHVQYRDDEIGEYRNRYAGFFCLLADTKASPDDLLEIYRRKDVVENCFDDLT
jgi:transposase